MNSSEVIIYNIKRRLIWTSPDVEYYKGVKIQRYQNAQWQSVAEYPRENDPGFYLMQPGMIYRVVSLWITGSRFFSAKYPEGTYLGTITEIVEEGYFSVTDLEHSGMDTLTIEDRVVVELDVKMSAPSVNNLDYYLPYLVTVSEDDISCSPVPGSKLLDQITTITDIYMPTLLTNSQEDISCSPVPGSQLFYGELNVIRYAGGSLINIG